MKANHSRQGRNARRCLITMLVVVASLPFAAREVAQDHSNPMAATVAQSFTIIERSFVSLADAMPEEKYGFKPTNGEFKDARTFGEQVKHVACGNFAFFNEIEKKEPPSGCDTGGPSPAKTKAELLTYLRESFAYAQSVLRTMTQANALEPVSGPYGGTSTRLGLATLAVWHASDHYGQLVVYLRMNGIVPPASQPAQSSERKEITVLPKILEAYVGTYQLGPKVNIMITLEGGQLMGQVSGQVKVALFASSDVKFFCKLVDAEIEFTKDEKGTVIGLILHQGGQDMNAPRTSDQVLVRKEVTVSSKILGQQVGTYELRPGFDLEISLEGDQLIAQATGQVKMPLFAEAETKFFSKVIDAQVEFLKDAKGAVTHLMLYQGAEEIKAPRAPLLQRQ